MTGVGRQRGALRPNWGASWADLACDRCGATWTGPIDEACAYCAIAEARLVGYQAEILLHPELPDIDDVRRACAVEAWGERLARGVHAGIVKPTQAAHAYEREKRRDRAA